MMRTHERPMMRTHERPAGPAGGFGNAHIYTYRYVGAYIRIQGGDEVPIHMRTHTHTSKHIQTHTYTTSRRKATATMPWSLSKSSGPVQAVRNRSAVAGDARAPLEEAGVTVTDEQPVRGHQYQ